MYIQYNMQKAVCLISLFYLYDRRHKSLNGATQLGVADHKMDGGGLALGHHGPLPLVDADLQISEGAAGPLQPAKGVRRGTLWKISQKAAGRFREEY